jgi:hypothetical protein
MNANFLSEAGIVLIFCFFFIKKKESKKRKQNKQNLHKQQIKI